MYLLYFRYTTALKTNVSCVEAFERLVQQRMLSAEDEQKLLQDLPWTPEDKWLCLMYQSKILTFQGTDIHGSFTKSLKSNGKHSNGLNSNGTNSNGKDSNGKDLNGQDLNGKMHQGGDLKSKRDIDVRFESVESNCGMRNNIDVQISKAECLLAEMNPRRAYELTTWVRVRDPFNLRCASIHVSSLVELGYKSELFYCAHNLVSAYPDKAIRQVFSQFLYKYIFFFIWFQLYYIFIFIQLYYIFI